MISERLTEPVGTMRNARSNGRPSSHPSVTSAAAGVAFWIFNYEPRWEAASKEVQMLAHACSEWLSTTVFALNLRKPRLRLRGSTKILPLPYALIGLPSLRWYSSRFGINHLFASAGERLVMPRLDPEKTLLTVTKDCPLGKIERNLQHLRKLRYIVSESDRHRAILRQGGVPEAQLRLIHPGTELQRYVSPTGPFTIVFASSPLSKHDMLSRGIGLLLCAAQRLPRVRFLLIWREHNHEAMRDWVRRFAAENVEIRNGYIPDMGAVYDAAHATILPGMEYSSLKPCPHSALESLARGKPILVSRPSSLARIVERNGCGVVFEPHADALVTAIQRLADDYETYQANCHSVIEQHFSQVVFLNRYRQLYASMLAPDRGVR